MSRAVNSLVSWNLAGGWGSGRCVEAHSIPVIGDRLVRRNRVTAAIDVGILYAEHRVRLTRLATAITLDRGQAEDIVQEAFAGLQRRRGAVGNPEGYLQRSVVNLSVKVLRRRVVARRHPVAPVALTAVPEIDETWAAVVRLPARQRAVVVLRYWEDIPSAEIARLLGWPSGTVKSTLHRALERLKKELMP